MGKTKEKKWLEKNCMKSLCGNSASTIGSEKEAHWATVIRDRLMLYVELNLAFESVI